MADTLQHHVTAATLPRFPSVNTLGNIAKEKRHVRKFCLRSKKVAKPFISPEIFGLQKSFGIRWI